jgi:hypothetical protein
MTPNKVAELYDQAAAETHGGIYWRETEEVARNKMLRFARLVALEVLEDVSRMGVLKMSLGQIVSRLRAEYEGK